MFFISTSVIKTVMYERHYLYFSHKWNPMKGSKTGKNRGGDVPLRKKTGIGECKIIQFLKLKINDRVSDLRKHNIFSWRTEI